MKNNFKFIFIFFFVLFSCQMKPKEAPKPTNLVSKDTFALILEELLIVEQQVGYKVPTTNSQFQTIAKNSGDYVLRNYNLTFEDFDSSFVYYNTDQILMKEIYDSISQKLTNKMNAL